MMGHARPEYRAWIERNRQYVEDKSYVVWPKSQAQRDAVLPLPKGTTFSNQ